MTMRIVYKKVHDGHKIGEECYTERSLAIRLCESGKATPYQTHLDDIYKAEQEKIQAEEDAKVKAKAKADAEAKVKAKLKAEEDAKAKAEKEAAEKAKADAENKADIETKTETEDAGKPEKITIKKLGRPAKK